MLTAEGQQHPFANSSPPSTKRPHLVSSRPPSTARPPRKPSKTLPVSASESALSRPAAEPAPPPPPAQPSRVRPFLLRGTSGTGGSVKEGAKGTVRSGEVKAAKEDEGKLRRSKTIPGLETVAPNAKGSAHSSNAATTTTSNRGADVKAKKPSTTRRTSAIRPLSLAGPSLRPLTPASSSALSSSRPRPFLHPELPPSPARESAPAASSAPPPHSPASSANLEAVERLKLQKKRETLLARQQQQQQHGGRLSSLTIRRDSPDLAAGGGEGADGSPMSRSRRWFSMLTSARGDVNDDGENVPPDSALSRRPTANDSRKSTSTSHRDRSPTPPIFASTSPNPPLSPVKRAALARANTAPATPPPKLPLRGPAGGKKRGYGGLGIVRVKRSKEEMRKKVELEREVEEQEEVVDEGMKHEEGYSSLQEVRLLERHGYRDTRVVTPQTKPRLASKPSLSTSSASPPPSASANLAPPAPSAAVKEKSSMLSLRGLFSLWGSSPASPAEPSPTLPSPQLAVDPVRDSPSGSNNTFTKQHRIRSSRDLQEWVSGVETAMAYSSSSASSVGPSYGATPQLDPSSRRLPTFSSTGGAAEADTFGSPTSGRSYSSSLSLSASPPTPHSLRHIANPSQPTLAVSCASPTGASLSPYGTCTGTARQSLRHVVSESALGCGGGGSSAAEAVGGYQSLTGLGIALPPSFLSDSPAYLDEEEDSPTPPASTPSVHITPPAPPPSSLAAGAGGGWLAPTAHFFLRQRASQVFSPFGAASSAVDAATGRTAAQRAAAAGAGGSGKDRPRGGGGGGGAGRPKLLRKAMSSAGLVRPVTTQAVVGTKSSAESLSLSIESVLSSSPPVGEERVGGLAGGEDLLGRRW